MTTTHDELQIPFCGCFFSASSLAWTEGCVLFAALYKKGHHRQRTKMETKPLVPTGLYGAPILGMFAPEK